MKITLPIIFTFLIILNSCDSSVKPIKESVDVTKSETKHPEKLLRHVVLFNFKDSATPDKVKEIELAFAGLKGKISEIYSFEWGINNSPEGLDKGFTHCFLVTFLSESDREKYLPHSDHKEFVTLIGPFVEDVTVVDYWTKS